MRRLGLLLAIVLSGAFAVVVGTTPAYACSCRPASVTEQVERSDVIFRGTVTSSTSVRQRGEQRISLRFEVDGVYKGRAYRDQVLDTNADSAACGFTPDVGTTWIVFAVEGWEGSGDRTVTRLGSSSCSGNLATSTAPRLLGQPRPRPTAPRTPRRRRCWPTSD